MLQQHIIAVAAAVNLCIVLVSWRANHEVPVQGTPAAVVIDAAAAAVVVHLAVVDVRGVRMLLLLSRQLKVCEVRAARIAATPFFWIVR